MPNFSYRCIGQDGSVQTGTMAAESEAELEEQLNNRGYWLMDAETEMPAPRSSGVWPFNRVTRRDLIQFSIQFSTQLDAGVPLISTLESAAQEADNPSFQQILQQVHEYVENGAALNEAMSQYPRVFPIEMVSLIKAGEESGNLPETFNEIRRHLEWVDQVMGDIKQASIYPGFIFAALIAFVVIIFSFVVPKFVELLEKQDVQLPMVTVIVFAASDIIKASWWIWLLALVLTPVAIKLGKRYSAEFAYYFDSFILKIPVFGELNQMVALSRFTHNMASLFRAGVPIIDAIQLCQGLVGNEVVKRALVDVEQELQQGEPMHKSMQKHPVISRMVVRMVAVGESTGELDKVLESISKFYNETIPRQVKKVFSVMEPLTILFIVGLVGVVAFAVFLPLIKLMQSMQ